MLTPDDIRSVPLFATLPPGEVERLAQTSADLHLAAGEFAVPEGGDRALYAVLTGRIEVVKLFDGVERRLGWRLPGTIFGEVPIAFGTLFVGGYRAAEPSRVFRVDPKVYYAVAATCPDLAVKVGALARERIGGLQGIAAEAPKARATIVGNRWDASCSALRHFLARNQITYDWMTPDAPELATRWPGPCPAAADTPAVRLYDALANGEAKSRVSGIASAGRVGAIESVEDTWQFLSRDTGAVVGNAHADLPLLHIRFNRHGYLTLWPCISDSVV